VVLRPATGSAQHLTTPSSPRPTRPTSPLTPDPLDALAQYRLQALRLRRPVPPNGNGVASASTAFTPEQVSTCRRPDPGIRQIGSDEPRPLREGRVRFHEPESYHRVAGVATRLLPLISREPMQKPREYDPVGDFAAMRAAEFCCDKISSSRAASTGSDACLDSARSREGPRRDRDAPDEGSAGVGRRGVRRRITPEASEWRRGSSRSEAVASSGPGMAVQVAEPALVPGESALSRSSKAATRPARRWLLVGLEQQPCLSSCADVRGPAWTSRGALWVA